jgi:hypothetical protein
MNPFRFDLLLRLAQSPPEWGPVIVLLEISSHAKNSASYVDGNNRSLQDRF